MRGNLRSHMILWGNRSANTDREKRYRRTNQLTYVVEILLVFAVSIMAEFAFDHLGFSGPWVDLGITALLLFLVGRAFAGRTHDIGRTDNWTLIPIVLFSAGWLLPVFWDGAPTWVEITGRLLWVLVLIAPALFKGDEGENKYGAPPENAIEWKVIANVG